NCSQLKFQDEIHFSKLRNNYKTSFPMGLFWFQLVHLFVYIACISTSIWYSRGYIVDYLSFNVSLEFQYSAPQFHDPPIVSIKFYDPFPVWGINTKVKHLFQQGGIPKFSNSIGEARYNTFLHLY